MGCSHYLNDYKMSGGSIHHFSICNYLNFAGMVTSLYKGTVKQRDRIFNVTIMNILIHLELAKPQKTCIYLVHIIMSTLVKVLTCRLFGTKPLTEAMLIYYQWYTQKHITVICSSKRICTVLNTSERWVCKWIHFVLEANVFEEVTL